MAGLRCMLLILVLCGVCCAHRRHSENETTRKIRQFESKLQKLETEIQAYPSTNSTSDRLEHLEVLVNLLLEDVYNVRADQEILRRDILGRLKQIEDKISEIEIQPSRWIQIMMTDHYKDFRPVKNYTDDDLPKVHRDCKDAYKNGWTSSGVYSIALNNGNDIDVFCDQESSNGGWIVIQRRVDGSVNFGRKWAQYKDGFGDLNGEFWIGNEKLHWLTAEQDTKLRVELQYLTDGFTEVHYDEFWLEDERDRYRLHVSGFTGSIAVGDSLSYHDGQYFSTVDADNDHSTGSCAAGHGGGWWYNSCVRANLNGVYTSSAQNGIFWKTWTGYSNTLKSVTMMVKGGDSKGNGSYVDGDLRLVHPSGINKEGRLEIVFNDTWGSICDDYFDDIDAMVACRQMGFDNGTYLTTKFPGTGPIWLDGLRCSPHHTRLIDCPHFGIGIHYCGHHEDAYITCHNTPEVNGSYFDGDLRLVHPSGTDKEGRLEIFFDTTWGTVCDDYFDDIDAMVACRQMGFANGTYQTTKLPGTGPIWLDNLHCSPYHTRLVDCPHSGIGNTDCSHNEDAYINCHDTPEVNGSYVNGDLRLVHPSGTDREGRLEIMLNNMWGSICDDNFDNVDAMVACRQMGFPDGTYKTTKIPGTGPIWLDDLQCSSYHTRLLDCPHRGIGIHNCGHSEDAYIACHDTPEVNGSYVNGDLRLVHPNVTGREGRLEIMLNDMWGSICDDNFDYIDAMVACRQMGFDNGMYRTTKIPGTGPIWLDDLQCSYNHTRLLDCPHRGIGIHNCHHGEDAYIACYDYLDVSGSYIDSDGYHDGDGDLRMVHPAGCKTEGRLEILWQKSWGTVCNKNFDDSAATVACKQMGFMHGVRMEWESAGSGNIWLDDVQCNVNNTRLMDCAHKPVSTHDCGHQQDVHIACFEGSTRKCCAGPRLHHAVGGNLRLVGGTCPDEGRLEIYHEKSWGTICNHGFGPEEAMVMCRELGYHSGAPMKAPSPGAGAIWQLSCSLNHRSVEDCITTPRGDHTCTHEQDAGVVCFTQT